MAVVVITGTNSGFGLETALGFARRGDTVVATMRDLGKSSALSERLARDGLNAEVRQLDVTDATSRETLVEGVLSDLGQIDVLVNNAGITQFGPAEEIDAAYHRLIFETNYWGPYELMRLVLPSMRARGSGRIVNVTSGAGVLAVPFFGAYIASKHALDGMSAVMDLELGPLGVRVVLVMPGGYKTEIGRKFPRELLRTEYPYNIEARFDAANADFDQREDLSPIVETVIEAATVEDPAIRYTVPRDNPLTTALVEALAQPHARMRRLTADRRWEQEGLAR